MAELNPEKSWRETVEVEQQEMFNLFGAVDWDTYPHDKLEVLESKVSVLLFGPMLEDAWGDEDNLKEPKMTDEEKKKQDDEKKRIEEQKKRKGKIDTICRVIVDEGTRDFSGNNAEKNAYMVFIFVSWKDEEGNLGCWPVFRVPNDNTGSNASFIDLNCRVYSNWKDFLTNNEFPACEYCYPRDGKYQCTSDGCVIVDFGTSPEAKVSRKAVKALDIASTGVAAAGTIVTIASLTFPLATPLLAASSVALGGVSGYSIIRSPASLYDRSTHRQGIGILDKEARGCYISILASTIGFGASAATTAAVRMAQNGQVMGRLATSAVTVLNGGALMMNGVGVINSLHHLVGKHQKGELTAFEVAQFSASVLLFCHSTVNFKTARTIIESTQDNFITDFKEGLRSNRHRKLFDKSLKNTVNDHGTIDGKALSIRCIKNIDNVDDFFAAMARTDKQVKYVKNKIAFAEGGTVLINNKLALDPRQLAALDKNQRVTLLRAAQRYNMNRISVQRFNDITKCLNTDIPCAPTGNIPLGNIPPSNMDKQSNGTQGSMIMKDLLRLLSAFQQAELNNILARFSHQFQGIILQLSVYIFRQLNQISGNQYMYIAQFVCKYVEHLMFYIVDGQRKYILAILGNKIRCVPPEDTTNSEYCLAILEQLVLQPTLMFGIFQSVKCFFEVLQEGFLLQENKREVNFLELVSVASTLMQLDMPTWLQVVECARKTLHALGYKKFSSLVAIVKDLCLYIEQAVIEMKEKYGSYRETHTDDDDDDISENYFHEYEGYCVMAVQSLNDPDVSKYLNDQICENNQEIFANEKSSYNIQTLPEISSLDTPFIYKTCFWSEGRSELLSESEIIDVCKQALKTDSIPTDYIIQCEGLKYFIVTGDKLITLECDVEASLINVHVDLSAFSASSNVEADVTVVNNECSNDLEESNKLEYTIEHPLILEKHFWANGERELLSQNEIGIVCKRILKINSMPEEYAIDYEGLKVLISIGEKIVVIECDVEADKLCAYVSTSTVLTTSDPNPNFISDLAFEGNSQCCYTEEVPLADTKCFDDLCESELSKEEILSICQETLNVQSLPQDCTVEFHGPKILVGVEDKVVVLKRDVETDIIHSYIDHTATLSTNTAENYACCNDENTASPTDHQNIYTKEDPLVMKRCFGDVTQCEFLSEDEIFNICKVILCESQLPQDASFEYYGSNIFVYLNDKIITIECDTYNKRMYAYMQHTNSSSEFLKET